jgi:hypothetical protein
MNGRAANRRVCDDARRTYVLACRFAVCRSATRPHCTATRPPSRCTRPARPGQALGIPEIAAMVPRAHVRQAQGELAREVFPGSPCDTYAHRRSAPSDASAWPVVMAGNPAFRTIAARAVHLQPRGPARIHLPILRPVSQARQAARQRHQEMVVVQGQGSPLEHGNRSHLPGPIPAGKWSISSAHADIRVKFAGVSTLESGPT